MPFFDFHLHPTLKCLFSDDDLAAGLVKLSPWQQLDQHKIPFLLRCCSDFQYILQSQGNLQQLVDSGCNLVCIALHMPEKDILTSDLIRQSSTSSLKAYLQPKKIELLTNGNPYKQLIEDDLGTLTNAAKFGITDKKVKVLNKRADYTSSDLKTIHVLFSVEGCHTLSSLLQHFDAGEVIANLDDLRSKVPVISINLTHMEQSDFCNNAYGMQFLSNDGFRPTGNKIGTGGISILQHCYQHKIMVDIKHMSLGARMHLYQLRGTADFGAINQPIVCTHAGFTGISVKEIPDYIFQQRKFSKGYTLFWQGKPVKYGGNPARPSFNASSINLYDEDILQILRSGGMIGLSMDKRILGYQEYEEQTSERDDFPLESEYVSNQELNFFLGESGRVLVGKAFDDGDKVLGWDEILDGGVVNPQAGDYHLLHFMAHVLHLVTVAEKFDYDPTKAMTQICIGSDFDGLINPIWSCGTILEITAFKNMFARRFVQFASDSHVRLPEGFDSAAFAEKLFFENGRDFVLGRLDAIHA